MPRFWTVVVIAAAALAVGWWWRKQARAALSGTQRTVPAPPDAGTQGVQASLMANPNPPPVVGISWAPLSVAAQLGNAGVGTFVQAFNVNSPKATPAAPAPDCGSRGSPKWKRCLAAGLVV